MNDNPNLPPQKKNEKKRALILYKMVQYGLVICNHDMLWFIIISFTNKKDKVGTKLKLRFSF